MRIRLPLALSFVWHNFFLFNGIYVCFFLFKLSHNRSVTVNASVTLMLYEIQLLMLKLIQYVLLNELRWQSG